MHEGDGPEFFTLLLGATLGMSLMASTSNLLMLFMAVEMASLPSYVLAGFRKTHRIGAEASLKYVLFGAATSAVMVYGLSMLYGLYGTLQVDADRPRDGDDRTLGAGGVGAAGRRDLRADRRHRLQDLGRAVPLLVPGRVRGRQHRRDDVPVRRLARARRWCCCCAC